MPSATPHIVKHVVQQTITLSRRSNRELAEEKDASDDFKWLQTPIVH